MAIKRNPEPFLEKYSKLKNDVKHVSILIQEAIYISFNLHNKYYVYEWVD